MAAGHGVDVVGMATKALAFLEAHFDASDRKLPPRRVIPPGATRGIAWDHCEQLVVTLAGIGYGPAPGTGSQTGTQTGRQININVRHAIIMVQLIRDVNSVESEDGATPPPADRITAMGLHIIRDAGVLSQALLEMCGPHGPFAAYGSALAGVVNMLGPDGGYVALEGNVTVTAGPAV